MTFLASVPKPLRSIVKEAATGWPPGDVYVVQSGSFPIERTLLDAATPFRLHSSGASLYTTALGAWLAGRETSVEIREEYADALGWLEPYLDGGERTVATAMLATRLAPSVEDPSLWHRRLFEGYREQWDDMHAGTLERLRERRIGLESFTPAAPADFVDQVPDDEAPVVAYGNLRNGPDGVDQRLAEFFSWPQPTWEKPDPEEYLDLVRKIADRPRWLVGTTGPEPELTGFLVGKVQTGSPNATPVHVYARGGTNARRVVQARIATEPVTAPRLSPGQEIGDRLTFAPIRYKQFDALRAKYLNRHIAVGAGMKHTFAVMVDGLVVGVFAFGGFTPGTPDRLILVTDFAVAPHDYPKLSKLVVMTAQSAEVRRYMERAWSKRIRSFQTTVFTNNKVSMKYRSLFDVAEREELPEGGGFRYRISYHGDAGRWTLAEALDLWKQKYGTRRPSREQFDTTEENL